MQSFDKESSDKIRKNDISVAKNYLKENEIKLLGLLVEQYLAFAEMMAQQQKTMYMRDWGGKLDDIIQLNEKLNNSDWGLVFMLRGSKSH